MLELRRLVQTALDFSLPFRQGVTIAFNPRKWKIFSKAFGEMITKTFDKKGFERLMYDIRKSPEYHNMVEDGIHFNDLHNVDNLKRNEDFKNSFIYQVPILREPLLASNRAADAFANVSRNELYLKGKKNLVAQGYTRQHNPEEYKNLGKWVMNNTGRGNMIKALETNPDAQKILGNTFYGARLMASRFNLLNPATYIKMSPGVRMEALKDVISFITTLTAAGFALKAAGATISLDPDDSDYLQVRFGEKVYDLTGGLAAYIRTFMRLSEAAASRFKDDKYQQGKKLEKAGTSFGRFFRNKLAPNTSYALNMFTGKDAIGKDFNPKDILKIYPMYVDDMINSWKDEGLTSVATVLIPNIFGIGYGSYAAKGEEHDIDETKRRNKNSSELNLETLKNFKYGGRELTNEEKQEYIKKRDDRIDHYIDLLYDGKDKMNLVLKDGGGTKTVTFPNMTEKQKIAATASAKERATLETKQELFGKGKQTKQEKLLELERKRLYRIERK